MDTNQSAGNDQTIDVILRTLRNQNPQNTKQLIQLVKQTTGLSELVIINLLICLENKNYLRFKKCEQNVHLCSVSHVFSKKAVWFWITIIITFITTLSIFIIPDMTHNFIWVRWFFGIIYVLFLPGFSLLNLIFPRHSTEGISSRRLRITERITLSVGVSLALTSMIGFFLNYTPWGIKVIPITISLTSLTTIFATIAFINELKVNDS